MKAITIFGLLLCVSSCSTGPSRTLNNPHDTSSREACLQACNRKAHQGAQSWRTGAMTLGDRPHQIEEKRPIATDSERTKALFLECVRKTQCERRP
jgi:hypothetical protein